MIDGDQADEFLIGAPGYSGQQTKSGKVYYIPSGDLTESILDLGEVRRSFIGAAAYDEAGSQVIAIGDVDGDNLEDALISAPQANGSSSDSGRVYLISSQFR